jgi:hypothetical protein
MARRDCDASASASKSRRRPLGAFREDKRA